MRFDEDGDEIEDDEISETAEINEDDPYSGVVLEGSHHFLDWEGSNALLTVSHTDLLGPLTSVADLSKHPSLSIPYTSHAIAELTQNAAEMVRKESATLWRMKQMFTKLRGDEIWAPCGNFETEDDRMIFAQPEGLDGGRTSSGGGTRRSESFGRAQAVIEAGNILPSVPSSARNRSKAMEQDTSNQRFVNGMNMAKDNHAESAATRGGSYIDVNGGDQESIVRRFEKNSDAALDSSMVNNAGAPNSSELQAAQGVQGESAATASNEAAPLKNGDSSAGHAPGDDEELPDAPAEDEGEEEGTASLEPRRVTRAQAKAPTSNDASSPPTISPETWIHPMFLVPASALPDKDFGLPAPEADETRKLLMLYVQKQEEVVRGLKTLHEGLMRANRMKNDVFKWSKAEAHLGEMSDGEDWYDKEEWGLEADLLKGKDEEEDEANLPGKKTRQRRQ